MRLLFFHSSSMSPFQAYKFDVLFFSVYFYLALIMMAKLWKDIHSVCSSVHSFICFRLNLIPRRFIYKIRAIFLLFFIKRQICSRSIFQMDHNLLSVAKEQRKNRNGSKNTTIMLWFCHRIYSSFFFSSFFKWNIMQCVRDSTRANSLCDFWFFQIDDENVDEKNIQTKQQNK